MIAARNQAGNRHKDICPSIEDYIALRKDTSAVNVSSILLPLVYHSVVLTCGLDRLIMCSLNIVWGRDVPDFVLSHPAIQALHDAGNDIHIMGECR